jgi:hypothetical protein
MALRAERRSSSRKSFNKSVPIELIAEKSEWALQGVPKSGTCLDVSAGGLGLKAAFPLKKGQVLKVFLPIQKVKTSLPVFGEVVWSEASDEHASRAGLRILH